MALRAQQVSESFEGFMSGIRANVVKGPVTYQQGEGKFNVEPGLKLEEGDFVRTGVDGLAELLLQPGNYLRVAGDTECQIFSDQHDKIRLKLNRGTISIEILAHDGLVGSFYSPDQSNELIRVITPNAEVFITRPGIFRINATNDRTELVSRDGEALIDGHRVKEKRRGVAANGSVAINEIDSRSEDAFDAWGRDRADKLVKANKSLKHDSPWAKNVKEGQEVSVETPEVESNDKLGRVISAKPGAVNFVEAGVEFNHANEWHELTEKSQLDTGDMVRTSKISFVELVLFPDMHIRLAGSSELLFKQLSNDSISLKLLRGSAILDVARFDRKQLPNITFGGPSRSVVIDDQGNYRIDAQADSEAITIRAGKVIFNERTVGACRRITGDTVIECDKKRYDNFDFWSQHRGEGQFFYGRVTVAKVTQLINVRRSRFKNTGFWFQQPGQTSYTFVPFTSLFFKSPYGGNYSTVLSPRRTMNRAFLGAGPTFRTGPEGVRP